METSWTESEIATVRELAALGMNARSIAEKLPGRTRNAVIGLWTRQGMARNRSSARNTLDIGTRPIIRRKPTRHNSSASAIQARIHRVDLPLPELAPPGEPAPLKVSLLDLKSFHCRKVVDGETDDDFCPLYCGHPTTKDFYGEDSSYCAYHHARFRVVPHR